VAIRTAVFRRSSAVEQLTVNQFVVGSIPTAGAKKFINLNDLPASTSGRLLIFELRVTFGVTSATTDR
jgi:hypothetical protein